MSSVPRYLRFTDLVEAGIVTNRMTLWRWVKSNDFPKPVKLGPNTVAWREDQVATWLATREQGATSVAG